MIDLTYIASNSFSGSTLLTLLLGGHPSIATVGELKWGKLDLQTYRCSCGDLLRECDYWRRLQVLLAERAIPFDLQNPRTQFECDGLLTSRCSRMLPRGPLFEFGRDAILGLIPGARQQWARFRQVNREVIRAMLDLDKAAQFVDASKDSLRLRYLIDSGDYLIRIIHLVRDGRAVTYSTIKNEGAFAGHAANEWVETQRQITRLAKRIPSEHYLFFRYEDLCRNPEDSLSQLCDFMKLDRVNLLEAYTQVKQHVLGNRMRLEAPGQIKLDEKWRTMLKPEQLAAFESIGGQLNRSFGYV